MDKKAIKELEELFTHASAGSIRQSLHEVFFSYLICNKQGFPANYERTVEDFYFLIRFLEKMEGRQGSGKDSSFCKLYFVLLMSIRVKHAVK